MNWQKIGTHCFAYGCMMAVIFLQPGWEWYHVAGVTGAYLAGILLGRWIQSQA